MNDDIIYYFYLLFLFINNINNKIMIANDVSELNDTQILDTIYVINIKQIIKIMINALINYTQISVCGTKHSMGGQSIAKNGYRIDMKYYDKILQTDIDNMFVTVESGLTWDKLIKHLNKFGMSPMTLQSYSTFSIGGSISVNIHGITNDKSVGDSIIEMLILTSNLQIVKCSRYHNSELFSLIIGGYGLFGIILIVKLKIVPNAKYKIIKYNLIVDNFEKQYDIVRTNKNIGIKMCHVNILTFDEIYLYCFHTKQSNNIIISNLDDEPNQMSIYTQFLYKWIFPTQIAQTIRYDIEKNTNIPFSVSTDKIERNQIMYESASSISKLYNIFIDLNQIHILQEFFIPNINFTPLHI